MPLSCRGTDVPDRRYGEVASGRQPGVFGQDRPTGENKGQPHRAGRNRKLVDETGGDKRSGSGGQREGRGQIPGSLLCVGSGNGGGRYKGILRGETAGLHDPVLLCTSGEDAGDGQWETGPAAAAGAGSP